MCTISAETVIRANEMTMRRSMDDIIRRASTSEGFNVSLRRNGKTFTQKLTEEDLRRAFGKAWNKVVYGKEV